MTRRRGTWASLPGGCAPGGAEKARSHGAQAQPVPLPGLILHGCPSEPSQGLRLALQAGRVGGLGPGVAPSFPPCPESLNA